MPAIYLIAALVAVVWGTLFLLRRIAAGRMPGLPGGDAPAFATTSRTSWSGRCRFPSTASCWWCCLPPTGGTAPGANPTATARAGRPGGRGPSGRAGRQHALIRRAGGLEIAGLSPPRRLCGPAGHLLDRPANPPGPRAHFPPPRRAGRPGRLPGSDRRAGDHRPVVGRLSRVHRRPERRPALRPRPRPHGPRRQFRPLPGHRPAGRLALAVRASAGWVACWCCCRADYGRRPLRQLHPQRLDRRRGGDTAGAGAHAPRAVADAGRGKHDRRRAAAGGDQDGQPRQLRSRIARCLRRQERRVLRGEMAYTPWKMFSTTPCWASASISFSKPSCPTWQTAPPASTSKPPATRCTTTPSSAC